MSCVTLVRLTADTHSNDVQVNIEDTKTSFRDFLVNFKPEEEALDGFDSDTEHEATGLYARQLDAITQTQASCINVNCKHLVQHFQSRRLYRQLIRYPQEVITIMDLTIHEEILARSGPDDDAAFIRRPQVRPFNLKDLHKLRDLDPTNIDQLVAIEGMVTRVSPIIPDLKQCFFKCFNCGTCQEVMIERGKVDEPSRCPHCNEKFAMDLEHNRCSFGDKQMIRLQETPDDIPEGETPQAVTLLAYDDLVDSVRPGDRVEVTGIFRAKTNRVNPKRRTVRSVYKT